MPTFTPPTRLEYRGRDRFWGRKADVIGRTVLKNGTAYKTVDEPTDEDVAAATIAYVGGHVYTVTTAEGDALTAAGYTVT